MVEEDTRVDTVLREDSPDLKIEEPKPLSNVECPQEENSNSIDEDEASSNEKLDQVEEKGGSQKTVSENKESDESSEKQIGGATEMTESVLAETTIHPDVPGQEINQTKDTDVENFINSKPNEQLEAHSDDEIEIEDASSDSPDSSSGTSSDSDSDSDSDSSSSSEGENSVVRGNEVLEDDEEGDAENGPIVSKNEVLDEEAPSLPEGYEVPSNAPLELIGEITAVVEKSVIINANISGEFRVLKENSILCLEDRTLLGPLFEIFGRIQSPVYRVKFNPDVDIESMKACIGKKAYYVVPDSEFVYTDSIKKIKGTDASNCHDEELPEEEQEFSDDEKELAVKQAKKKRKKNKNPANKTDNKQIENQAKKGKFNESGTRNPTEKFQSYGFAHQNTEVNQEYRGPSQSNYPSASGNLSHQYSPVNVPNNNTNYLPNSPYGIPYNSVYHQQNQINQFQNPMAHSVSLNFPQNIPNNAMPINFNAAQMGATYQNGFQQGHAYPQQPFPMNMAGTQQSVPNINYLSHNNTNNFINHNQNNQYAHQGVPSTANSSPMNPNQLVQLQQLVANTLKNQATSNDNQIKEN